MQIFHPDFVNAVATKLATLDELSTLTREQVLVSIGVDKSHVGALSSLLLLPEFAREYETVKGRGIRRKRK